MDKSYDIKSICSWGAILIRDLMKSVSLDEYSNYYRLIFVHKEVFVTGLVRDQEKSETPIQ